MRKEFFCVTALGAVLWLAGGCDREGMMPGPKPPAYRTESVGRRDIVRTVEATGTVAPIKKVEVGAQVNGKILKLFVDYNSIVTNGQLVALIDPQVYDAQHKSARAQLESNRAAVLKCEAELVLAEKTLARKKKLLDKQMTPVADYDSALSQRDAKKAALLQARAQVLQSEASLQQAKANLDYCTIRSTVNGVVTARSVDEGQTVVSSMNAVALVTIAENLKRIQVEATVPEADVGNIRVGQRVTFTADAYRKRFTGVVKQVRLAATTTNNVVTYPIVIEADNDDPEAMLFPGMTANITVETARAPNALAVSAMALRFRPNEADRAKAGAAFPDGKVPRGRKLWFVEDGALRPVLVKEGISGDDFTQILDPADIEGRNVVIGYETEATKKGGFGGKDTENPFMPKHPQHNKNKGTAPEPKG